MTEKFLSWVFRIRFWLYCIGLLALLTCSVRACNCTVVAYELEVVEPEEREDFWPPDFIPHPLPPWDRPKRPSEGDLA